MKNVAEQKIKLEQKKNRLAQEEIRLKLKERKMRTRHLIEIGGLLVKAGLDHLPTNTLYGALISNAQALKDDPTTTKHNWTALGKKHLDQEEQNKIAIILKFDTEPNSELKSNIRNYGLRWNKLRSEWYGYVTDLDSLKDDLKQFDIKYNLEIIGSNVNQKLSTQSNSSKNTSSKIQSKINQYE